MYAHIIMCKHVCIMCVCIPVSLSPVKVSTASTFFERESHLLCSAPHSPTPPSTAKTLFLATDKKVVLQEQHSDEY